MGASMSAPTPISQDPSDIAYEFLGRSPAAIGPVNKKAAPASHGHGMGSSPAQPIGFGLMQVFHQPSGFTAAGGVGLFTNKFMTQLAIWTLEGWLGPGNNPGGTNVDAGCGFTNNESSLVTPWTQFICGIGGSTLAPNATNNSFRAGGQSLLLPASGQPSSGLPVIAAQHFAMSCDGSVIRCYWEGALVGTLPAVSTPPAQFGVAASCTTAGTATVTADEIRLSSVARYTGSSLIVPTEPFVADADTVLLWHLDNSPLGVWAGPYTGDAYTFYTGGGSFQMEDASGNGNVGFVGQDSSSGGGSTVQITGEISTVSPTPSGRVATNAVLSLQAQTGDLVLTDTAGNSLATPVPQSDGTIQLQMAALSAGSTPWTSVPYWLLRAY